MTKGCTRTVGYYISAQFTLAIVLGSIGWIQLPGPLDFGLPECKVLATLIAFSGIGASDKIKKEENNQKNR